MSVTEIQSRVTEIQQTITALRTGSTTSGAAFARAMTSAQGTAAGGGTTGTALDGTGAGVSGDDVVADAKKYLGVPYVFGSTDPAKGLDCSSFVQRVYKDLGVELPRLVRHQRLEGTAVPSLAQAKPGDLLVFDGYQHIGIYLGDNKVIHAPQPGEKIKISTVWEKPTSIRRIIPDSAATGGLGQYASLLNADAAGLTRPSALSSTDRTGTLPASTPYGSLFVTAGRKHGVSPALLAAVAKVESGYNARAVSSAGAQGLMQIMPATARGLGVNAFDPAQAVDGAARKLAADLRKFDGSVSLALAAYNAGAGAVQRYGGIPPYAETQAYVPKVLAAMRQINGGS